MNSTQDMASIRKNFLKRFNPWGQNQREQQTSWHYMKYDHTKHKIKHFSYDLDY